MRLLWRLIRRLAIVSLLVGSTAGCAGVSPMQVGHMAGVVAGAAIAPGIGAPVGGLIGLLAGMVVQHQVDRVTERRERQTLAKELKEQPSAAPSGPQLATSGSPRRVWVDEAMEEGRVVPGHFEVRTVPSES